MRDRTGCSIPQGGYAPLRPYKECVRNRYDFSLDSEIGSPCLVLICNGDSKITA